MEIVQGNAQAMLIIKSNHEADDYLDFMPGSNTVAYFPLKNSLIDKSSYNRQIVMGGGNITFVNQDGVDCAYFNNPNKCYFSTNITDCGNTFTISMWINALLNSTWSLFCFVSQGAANSQTRTVGINPYISSKSSSDRDYYGHGTDNGSAYTDYISSIKRKTGWHNYTLTFNGTSYVQYLDGVAIKSGTQNITPSKVNSLRVGIRNNILTSSEFYNGYMSRFVLENKVWTAQEVLDYYNKTISKL